MHTHFNKLIYNYKFISHFCYLSANTETFEFVDDVNIKNQNSGNLKLNKLSTVNSSGKLIMHELS